MHRVGVEKPSEENIIPKKYKKEAKGKKKKKKRKEKEWCCVKGGRLRYPDKSEERPWRPRAETALSAGPERLIRGAAAAAAAQHTGRDATSCRRLQNKTRNGWEGENTDAIWFNDSSDNTFIYYSSIVRVKHMQPTI